MSAEATPASALNKKQKVYYAFYPNKITQHPMIRLAGIYLQSFDFNVGDTIEVAVNTGEITIKKVLSEA